MGSYTKANFSVKVQKVSVIFIYIVEVGVVRTARGDVTYLCAQSGLS